MRRVKGIGEDEMIAVFLYSELGSKRFRGNVLSALEQQAVEARLIESPNLSDELENHQRRNLLGELRGLQREASLFRLFPADARWSRATLTDDELRQVLYTKYDYWVELSGGSRSPTDAAERIRTGVEIFNQPNAAVWSAATALKSGEHFNEMIFVTHDGRRLVVLEGHVRLTSLMLADVAIAAETEVIVGQSPSMGDWPLY